MTDDIVTRLRDSSGMTTCRSDDGFMSIVPDTMLMRDAADEIERLRDEVEHWRRIAETEHAMWANNLDAGDAGE